MENENIAKSIQIAFFIDEVMAKAYPRGTANNRDYIVERLRWYIEQDDKMPTLSEAVSFAKNTH